MTDAGPFPARPGIRTRIARPRLQAAPAVMPAVMPAVAPTYPAIPANAWKLVAILAVFGGVYYFVGRFGVMVVAVIAAFALFMRFWIWLSFRFPRTMMVINLFLAAFLNSGRRSRY